MAKVKMTDDGLVYCSACSEVLICDECGDMPEVCPSCGRDLDYSSFNRLEEVQNDNR